jgi:hypothetical protein
MKHTLWDRKYSRRDELSRDALLVEFDPSSSLDRPELFHVLELVAKTTETPVGKLRPQDRFDEIFEHAPTRNLRNLLGSIRTAFKLIDLDTGLEDALEKRCKENNLPMYQATMMTLKDYIAVWFGLQSKAA